jgi:hypothetical protein
MLNQSMFMTDIETTLEIFELAKNNGKKPGDNCQEEFDIILKQKPHKFIYLGNSDKDVDLMSGNLREKGLKILNLKEIERRQKIDNKDN